MNIDATYTALFKSTQQIRKSVVVDICQFHAIGSGCGIRVDKMQGLGDVVFYFCPHRLMHNICRKQMVELLEKKSVYPENACEGGKRWIIRPGRLLLR